MTFRTGWLHGDSSDALAANGMFAVDMSCLRSRDLTATVLARNGARLPQLPPSPPTGNEMLILA
jgi:hypothetical protein